MESRYRGLAKTYQILSKSCPNYAIAPVGAPGWLIVQQELRLAYGLLDLAD